MAEIRDVPGQLDLVLFPGRPTTLTLTWPSTLAGKTFSCSVDYGDGTGAHSYTVVISTVTMTIVLAPTDYATELGPGTITIRETTGGLTTPIIFGRVRVSREVTTSQTTATVNVPPASTVTITLAVWPVINATYATVAARTLANPTPSAGNLAYLTTPKILTAYNGASWDGQFPSFATLAAVTTAIPTPDTGMTVRVSGLGESLIYWNGTRWCFVADPATFSTKVARDAAITAPVAGDFAYLSTPTTPTFYNGTTWDGQFPTFATAAARNTAIPSPDKGTTVQISGDQIITMYDGSAWRTIADYSPTSSTVATNTAYTTASAVESDITVSAGTAPTLTLTLDTTRTYCAMFNGRFRSTVATDTASVRLIENGVSRGAAVGLMTADTVGVSLQLMYIFMPASGASIVYKMSGARVSGTGTVSAVASATTPMQFAIFPIS